MEANTPEYHGPIPVDFLNTLNVRSLIGYLQVFIPLRPQELDVNIFSVLVYPLRSKGKDGHFAAAQIVSG